MVGPVGPRRHRPTTTSRTDASRVTECPPPTESAETKKLAAGFHRDRARMRSSSPTTWSSPGPTKGARVPCTSLVIFPRLLSGDGAFSTPADNWHADRRCSVGDTKPCIRCRGARRERVAI